MVTGGTVAEVLELAEIELGEYDEVDLPLDSKVSENDTISITRKSILHETTQTELPYETEIIPTPLLAPGTKRVLSEGQDGLIAATYERTIIDGIEMSSEVISETVDEPVDAQVLVGAKDAAISKLDFEYELDENGEPIGYTSVLRGQRAAGYTASPGALTSTGKTPVKGLVAVNPSVIPYGTKLYIKSAGSDNFVYGYAVAADTGGSLMRGVIDVDLYYDSYLECALNELRSVDIFILD